MPPRRPVPLALSALALWALLPGCAAPGELHPLDFPGKRALAGPPPARTVPALFSGIKLGTLAHDAGLTGQTFEKGTDGNAELLFRELPPTLDMVGTPRPHLGFTVNSRGGTSQAYSGLTWTIPLQGRFFSAIALGAAAHDGRLVTQRGDAKGLGRRILFRAALEVGYRFSARHQISIMADHVSNAGLADVNEGLDTIGIRLGYSF